MISDLKKRTAGRDMYKVLSQMEGREITPPRRKNNYSPSPPPEPRNGKRSEPAYSSRAKYGAQNRYGSEEDDRVDRADNFSSRYG
jgi:hypothetical protein